MAGQPLGQVIVSVKNINFSESIMAKIERKESSSMPIIIKVKGKKFMLRK